MTITLNRHSRVNRHGLRRFLLAATLLPFFVQGAWAAGDWPAYGGDTGGNARFSPLAQITPANVATLKPAWTWDSGEPAGTYQVTPLVIGHVMFLNTPKERVVALDADTGTQLWSFDPKLQRTGSYRGVSYWAGDAKNPARIIASTTDGKIYALDAKTGALISGFGDNGMVDMHAQLTADFPTAGYGFTTPATVFKNLIIFGPRVGESSPGGKGPDAAIRALDVRTGKQVWMFHTLPRPGDVGFDTWGPDFYNQRRRPQRLGRPYGGCETRHGVRADRQRLGRRPGPQPQRQQSFRQLAGRAERQYRQAHLVLPDGAS